jgi:DNA-binding transcriptional MerR regulator
MRMQKRQFRIGELAKHLDVEKFVIRFWEKEFDLSATRSVGGQRFYTEQDLEQFTQIKTLLYEQGFTIAGAKKKLSLDAPEDFSGSHKTTLNSQEPKLTLITQQLTDLKIQLQKLKELLL